MPFIPVIRTPIPCAVCGAPLKSGAIVVCEHCGSELHLEKPPAGGPVVKRGSTPAGRRVVEVVVARFKQSHKIDLAADAMAIQRITEVSERAAREIETKGVTAINVPFVSAGPSGPVHLDMKLSKADGA